ncbi:hypothetical protein V5799_012097 [Amblyomma americanum]|uniref:Uncharacterized protein n=1 Tax=Amblyomma americanum TaxID=6943 RepID=A0AAQ4EFS3_AMBAM
MTQVLRVNHCAAPPGDSVPARRPGSWRSRVRSFTEGSLDASEAAASSLTVLSHLGLWRRLPLGTSMWLGKKGI